MTRPAIIALTPGEPAGIGPDLCIQLAQQATDERLVMIADPQVLQQRAAQRGRSFPYRPWQGQSDAGVYVLPITAPQPTTAGHPHTANAAYVLQTLERAAQGCLQGEFDALVTGPVHKGIINDAGIPFTGHTEFLAERAGVAQVVMMLATEGLRVALATTHLPLAQVSAAITREHLTGTLRILHSDLQRRFGLAQPRILVCGLNPHAGEGGHLGREEIDVIGPVLEALRTEGMALRGPLPADTVFTPPYLREADVVLAMYHDQGLPVLKHMGFGNAVNITLGLPFIRTSVDHGTALERAGTGHIDSGSLMAALRMARNMIRT